MNGCIFDFPLLGNSVFAFPSDEIGIFVSRQLQNYVKKTVNVNSGDWEIEIFNRDVVKTFNEAVEKRLYVSRNFKMDDGRIVLDNLEYICTPNSIRIKYIQNKTIIFQGKQIVKKFLCLNEEMKYRNNSGVFYNRYLFPLLSAYAACYGYYCIHGSLIRLKDKNIVLAGLDGVGKSTMANSLSSEEGDILADNIVMFNGITALNFNIAMRIDSDTESKYRTVLKFNGFKEILPDNIGFGEVIVDRFYNLIRDQKRKTPHVEEISENVVIWTLFLNTAPEIERANRLMAPWGYICSDGRKEEKTMRIKIFNLYIPENGLAMAKEIIKNGC